MDDDPPSILPRGTIILPSLNPSPQSPASAVYIQSVSGLSWSTGQAAGISAAGGGGPPASKSATRQAGSSESRAATTAPAEPPPTTTKSKDSVMWRKVVGEVGYSATESAAASISRPTG